MSAVVRGKAFKQGTLRVIEFNRVHPEIPGTTRAVGRYYTTSHGSLLFAKKLRDKGEGKIVTTEQATRRSYVRDCLPGVL